MCDEFGALCKLCERGEKPPHGLSVEKAKKGEYMRAHKHLGLLIGAHEQEYFEREYAKHGVLVTHKDTGFGDMAPVCATKRDFDRIAAARGLTDRS